MPTVDGEGFSSYLSDLLRGHHCVFCENDSFMIGDLVAPARSPETPDHLNPNQQMWQTPVTCDRCGHVNYFAVPNEFLRSS